MPFNNFKLVIREFHHSRNRAKCYRTVIQYKVPYQTALVCLRNFIKINRNIICEMLCPETNTKQTNHETREQHHNCQKKELCLWIKKIKPEFFLHLINQ